MQSVGHIVMSEMENAAVGVLHIVTIIWMVVSSIPKSSATCNQTLNVPTAGKEMLWGPAVFAVPGNPLPNDQVQASTLVPVLASLKMIDCPAQTVVEEGAIIAIGWANKTLQIVTIKSSVKIYLIQVVFS